MHKILLVEDDIDYATVLKQYLEASGYDVLWIDQPEQTVTVLELQVIDLVILDIMLPNTDGFTLAKTISNRFKFAPFLFLTAKNQNIDRLMGLKLGAADYVSKICDPEELVLRIQNILKSAQSHLAQPLNYHLGDYLFTPEHLKLIHPKQSYRLTARERDLLLLLLNYNQKIVKRETILEALWPENDYFSGRSLDVFITRLRKYLNRDERLKIESIRGLGYEVHFPQPPPDVRNNRPL